jgi:urea transporter/murein DD-endopeptidase MepM/ murein hydrolase activator NlpD
LNSDNKSYRAFLQGIPNSYALIFFSNNQVFAWILIVVTFFDPISGLAGLLSIIISNLVAWLAGLNLDKIRRGYYGFNSLLVGLGLGLFYAASGEFLLILVFTALLTLFLTVALEGIIGKYQLPYLSLPFLFGIWLAIMASRDYVSLSISDRGVYSMNEMYTLGGMTMVRIYEWFNHLALPQSIVIYLRSMGAIFFQYHLFPGLLIAIGLLIYSRIAFSLSLMGFYAAYFFYYIVGADINTLTYSYIGFNFILTAIAIGGFFIIPSWYSYLWIILLTPITSILLTAFKMLFTYNQLSIYSLPFNIVVLVFLYVLKFRERHLDKPELVLYQQFSPERNLYSQRNNDKRFGNHPWFKVALPFWGEWTVTQGHNGEITHKENWRHAWDFEIMDEMGRSYGNSGADVSDYHCYSKPVLAPADGWIEDIADGIEDNAVGEVNLEQNWGNTVVIRHSDYLFSAMSHLKKDSIKASRGDFVKKGDIIASCGSSGRSPVPHLHFQFQSTPQIGSRTLDLPLLHYIHKTMGGFLLRSSDYPAKNESVSNIENNDLLRKSYSFVPGQEIIFRNEKLSRVTDREVRWEVCVNYLNHTYLYCHSSHSKAFFVNESDQFYFTHFEGEKSSLLYYFYLGSYKVIFGFYRGLKVVDHYPLSVISRGIFGYIQDFLAPFYLFTKSVFTLEYVKSAAHISLQEMLLHSEARVTLPFKSVRQLSFKLFFLEDSMEKFVIQENKNKPTEWVRIKNT